MAGPRRRTQLGQAAQVVWAGAEQGQALPLRQVPEDAGLGVEGRAVVEHQGAAGGQGADQPVPHHPTAGSEEEQPVVAAQVRMQQMLLGVLQQGAANAVNDALGPARGAGRIQDVERSVEVELLEGGVWAVQQRVEGQSVSRRA